MIKLTISHDAGASFLQETRHAFTRYLSSGSGKSPQISRDEKIPGKAELKDQTNR
jgi:hypothetical protein